MKYITILLFLFPVISFSQGKLVVKSSKSKKHISTNTINIEDSNDTVRASIIGVESSTSGQVLQSNGDGTVSWIQQQITTTQDTIQGGYLQLRVLDSDSLSSIIYLHDWTYTAPNDSIMTTLGGIFCKSIDNSETENGATVIIALDGQVWLRDSEKTYVDPRWYEGGGYDFSGTEYTDFLTSKEGIYNDRDRLQESIKLANASNVREVIIPQGSWEIDYEIELEKDIHVSGMGEYSSYITRPNQPNILATSNGGSNTITVDGVERLRVGQTLWFLDTTAPNGGLAYAENQEGTGSEAKVVITNISGNTITTNTTIPAVVQSGWRVIINSRMFVVSTGKEIGSPKFSDLTIDGNKNNNAYTLDWRALTTMNLRSSDKFIFRDITFVNIPSENIIVDYVDAYNLKGFDLNGSLFHLSNDDPSEAKYTNTLINVQLDGVNQGGNTLMNHSEAAITYSVNTAPIVLQNCVFRNGNEAVIGNISDNDQLPIKILGCSFYNFTANSSQGQGFAMNTNSYKEFFEISNSTFENCGYIQILGDDAEAGDGFYYGLFANNTLINTRLRITNSANINFVGNNFEMRNGEGFTGFDDQPFPSNAYVYIQLSHDIYWTNNHIIGLDTIDSNAETGLYIDVFTGGTIDTFPVSKVRNIYIEGGTIKKFRYNLRTSNSFAPDYDFVVENFTVKGLTIDTYKDSLFTTGNAYGMQVPAGAYVSNCVVNVSEVSGQNSNSYPVMLYGVSGAIDSLHTGAVFINNWINGSANDLNSIRLGTTSGTERSQYNIVFHNNFLSVGAEDDTEGNTDFTSFTNFIIDSNLFPNLTHPRNLPLKRKYQN